MNASPGADGRAYNVMLRAAGPGEDRGRTIHGSLQRPPRKSWMAGAPAFAEAGCARHDVVRMATWHARPSSRVTHLISLRPLVSAPCCEAADLTVTTNRDAARRRGVAAGRMIVEGRRIAPAQQHGQQQDRQRPDHNRNQPSISARSSLGRRGSAASALCRPT